MTYKHPILQIAICDDKDAQIGLIRPIIQEIVKDAGYSAEIRTFTKLAELDDYLERRPHFVFVDNVFGVEENAGVDFIAKRKRDHPDSIFILLTGATFNVDQLGFRIPNPDIIATKSHISTNSYRNYLGEELFSKLKRYPLSTINIDAAGSYSIKGERLDFAELHSLIEQAICEAGLVEVHEMPTVGLKRLSGGYSGALTLEMTIRGRSRWADVPTVVKIAPLEWMKDEQKAFQTFARWQLPHTLRVDIIGIGGTNKWGAICYAFVLAGETTAISATKALNNANVAIVDRVIGDVFEAKATGWYKITDGNATDLNNFLANRPEFDPNKDMNRDAALANMLGRAAALDKMTFHKIDGGFLLNDKQISSIRRVIFQHQWGRAVECYCHGDFNSNNIMTNADTSKLGLIDFSDTGINHVFRDFVSFESSIRLEWVEADLEAAVTFEENIANEKSILTRDFANVPAYPDYLEQVAKVREAAFKMFPHVPISHYAALVALHHWKTNAVYDWGDVPTRRAMSAIIAGLDLLLDSTDMA